MTDSVYDLYPPQVLRDYAMVADGERGALIGPRGDVAWMCAPRWHDEGVFSTLIGGTGLFAVTPTAERFVSGGSYSEGSLIWSNRWVTTDGTIECDNALVLPGDEDRAVLVRRVRALKRDAQVRLLLDVRAGFGRHGMADLHSEDGVWSGSSGPLNFRLTGAPHARRQGEGHLEQLIEVAADGFHDLVLEVSSRQLPAEAPGAQYCWSETKAAWQQSVPKLEDTIAGPDARQSYAVLRGLTSSSGAMVAAATTSLPERADERRNYDYRYAWIRDQCYAGQAVAACGNFPLLDDAVHFISGRLLEDGINLRPAYTVTGGDVPDEANLDLPGYPGGRDVVGNRANRQYQLDAFGESLSLFAAAAGHDRMGLEHWQAADICVDAIAKQWTQPDAGLWELDTRHWTHSKLICAAGLRRLAGHASTATAARWLSLADRIVAETSRTSVHPTGYWKRAPDDDRVDASLLRPPLRGALAATDPRTTATIEAVRDSLSSQGYVYRFRQDDRPLYQAEGAFLLCGFDMAMAVHQQGDTTQALRWFERNRAACGSPGLFTEEYDIGQRQLRGNFPQAFVHAAMLESAGYLAGSPEPG
ncbi:glycoside hydrolase family 15 protein [Arthrobacter castelli]|uniref:glycoside hydrolase family 15 protein n=1 Tax=Arthrobacter castelli TaxID=271431 RepID=UPI00040B1062|nr:glycoside hydrolase family 15 protein [Arthrobacter castelli]